MSDKSLSSPQIWRQGFPNVNLSCYFNSFVQMYINCLDKLPWQERIQSIFHQKARQLKNIDTNKYYLILLEMNSSVVYSNQDKNQGNDPLRVMSAVIENTLECKIPLQLNFLPFKFREVYEDTAKDNSEISFLFQSIFCKGTYCSSCPINSSISENIAYFVTLNSKSEQESKPIQNMIDKMCLKIPKETTCHCGKKMENICGFIKLPKFLYLNLNQVLNENAEIDHEIKLQNEAEDQEVTYSLEGVINHPPAHYTYCRRLRERKWIHYDDDYVSDIEKPRFPKGLLYVATNNMDENISIIKVDQLSKQNHDLENKSDSISSRSKQKEKDYNYQEEANINPKNERETKKIFESLKPCGYSNLKTEDQDDILISGEHKKYLTKEQVLIKILTIQEGLNAMKYSLILKEVESMNSPHVFKSTNSHHLNSLNKYAVSNSIDSLTNFEKYFVNKDEKSRITFFIELIEFLQKIENKGLNCDCLSLKNIWVNKQKQWGILAFNLVSDQQTFSKDTLNCIKSLILQLFPNTNQLHSKEVKKMNQIISDFQIKEGEQKIRFDELFESIKGINNRKENQSNQNMKSKNVLEENNKQKVLYQEKGKTDSSKQEIQNNLPNQTKKDTTKEAFKVNDPLKSNQLTTNLTIDNNTIFKQVPKNITSQKLENASESTKQIENTNDANHQTPCNFKQHAQNNESLQKDIKNNVIPQQMEDKIDSQIEDQNINNQQTSQTQKNDDPQKQSSDGSKEVEKEYKQPEGSNQQNEKSANSILFDFWTSLNYTSLVIVEENKYKCIMKGKNKYSENVLISMIKVQIRDIDKYGELIKVINSISPKFFFKHAQADYQPEIKSFVIVNSVNNMVNAQEYFSSNNCTSQNKFDIFNSVILLLKQVNNLAFKCPPIKLKHIWRNNDNNFRVLSQNLFFKQQENLNQTPKMIISWLEQLLLELFPKNTIQKQSINYQILLDCLQIKNSMKLNIDSIIEKIKLSKNKMNFKEVSTQIQTPTSIYLQNQVHQEKGKQQKSNPIIEDLLNFELDSNELDVTRVLLYDLLEYIKEKNLTLIKLLDIRGNNYLITAKKEKQQVLLSIFKGKTSSYYLQLINKNQKSIFVMKYLDYFIFQGYSIIVEQFENYNTLESILKNESEGKTIEILINYLEQLKSTEQENIFNLFFLEPCFIWFDSTGRLLLSQSNLLPNSKYDDYLNHVPMHALCSLQSLLSEKYPSINRAYQQLKDQFAQANRSLDSVNQYDQILIKLKESNQNISQFEFQQNQILLNYDLNKKVTK